MLIQPSVQSPPQAATFTSSVSATGVEQTVSRAPIPPVEQASRDAGTRNGQKPFQPETAVAPAAAPASPAADTDATRNASPASANGETDSRSSSEAPDRNPARQADALRAQQQEQATEALIAQLRVRDREVRLHEAAHAAVGGRYAGAPTYQFQRGPDGRNYAVGGEVSISVGPVPGDPQATIEKARIVRAAALAPAEPSSQDRRVAAEASQLELDARTELRQLEVQARADAEKARQEAAEERSVNEEAQVSEPAQTAREDTANTPPVSPTFVPAVPSGQSSTDKPAGDNAAPNEDPTPNAREQLEQILLGSTGILVQANRQGLVDPQNPFGKSGYLNVIA